MKYVPEARDGVFTIRLQMQWDTGSRVSAEPLRTPAYTPGRVLPETENRRQLVEQVTCLAT